MKIVMILKSKQSLLLFLIGFSLVYSLDVNTSIKKVLNDSLININEIDLKYSNQPEYLFLSALVDSDGEIALQKYKDFYIKSYTFISKNKLSFFAGCVVKYVCRYLFKGTPIQDLEKIIHYCELEIERIKEERK